MSPWAITVFIGVLTGIGLYALVRLRMLTGPIAAQRWGVWGRRAVWIALIAAMVALAELDLIWLRGWLEKVETVRPRWHYEAAFALLLLFVGLGLVCGRVYRRRVLKKRDAADVD